MNILSTNFFTTQYRPNFSAKSQNQNQKKYSLDVFELSQERKALAPDEMVFSENESLLEKLFVKLKKLEMNIKTQKEMLKNYYSVQDKIDYQELLKEKRQVKSKITKIAKDIGVDPEFTEVNIEMKKEYNWYARKICRATSKKSLAEIEKLIFNDKLIEPVKKLLLKLIKQHRELM